jgi:NAD(P)-dependent dehydrogenase (short-subunit alcohol dehydrogenase family)
VSARRLIVTGASSGVGHATAAMARGRGWEVLASLRDDADRPGLEGLGCHPARLDLRDEKSIAAFATGASAWCGGRLDALVNNAGTALAGPVEELDLVDIREQFAINTFGQIGLTQALLPALREAGGWIVFVSSDRATGAVPGYGAYIASKRALEGFAEVLAAEVARFGIGVTIVELGSFESKIRGPIAARLAECARTTAHYGALIEELAAVLGSPPLFAPELAAEAILDLLEMAAPPLTAVFPPGSHEKVLRHLERRIDALRKTTGKARSSPGA